jgi:hypothetical protein
MKWNSLFDRVSRPVRQHPVISAAAGAALVLAMVWLSWPKAKFAAEQAKAQFEILKSTTNSDFMTVELKLKFAKVDHEKYDRGQLLVDLVEASNKLVQVDAQLAVNLDTYINSTNLAAKGYETKQKVDADRLNVLNNKNSLIVASGCWCWPERGRGSHCVEVAENCLESWTQ